MVKAPAFQAYCENGIRGSQGALSNEFHAQNACVIIWKDPGMFGENLFVMEIGSKLPAK
jgi:hypothetical protein